MQYPIEKLTVYAWDPREEITNENKKRQAEREFHQLKHSISIGGIRVPLMVVPSNGTYEVIGGRHRLQAAKELGLKTVPIAILEDVDSEVKKRRDAGTENNIRSGSDSEDLCKWVYAMYEAGGYNVEEAMKGAKAIDNWFSVEKGRTWDDLNPELSSGFEHAGRETNPYLKDKKFVELCKSIPYTPKYQYQIMSILSKLDDKVRAKAKKKGLSTNKQISLTTGLLPKHPDIQKELIDEISEMPADKAKTRVQQIASDLSTGRLKKRGKSYAYDYSIPREDGKVLPPLNVRIVDIGTAINKYLFYMTERAITKGETQIDEQFITNTKDYRLDLLKTLSENSLYGFRRGLRLVKLVTDETLELIKTELETLKDKKELLTK